jgi:hypothetical protein
LSSSRAVSLDGVFILDRINAKEIIPEFPQYDFPRIDTADCKENGKWFKRYLTFKTVKVNNIDVQYSNEELNGIIEVKIWRCKFIREKSKEPDNSPEIGVNNISHHNNTQNSIFVACLGPKKNSLPHEVQKLRNRRLRIKHIMLPTLMMKINHMPHSNFNIDQMVC